jgi:hypothetical protein
LLITTTTFSPSLKLPPAAPKPTYSTTADFTAPRLASRTAYCHRHVTVNFCYNNL